MLALAAREGLQLAVKVRVTVASLAPPHSTHTAY
jgi:hypothetical protein